MAKTVIHLTAIFFLISVSTRLLSQELQFAKDARQESQAVKILFVGDVMLDGGPGHAVTWGRDPFDQCKELFLDTDLNIANLECVVGKGGEQQLKAYVFRAPADSTRFLKKYFHVVGLANNHSMDFGVDGMLEMLKILDENELPYFGAGRNIAQATTPFVTEIHGHKIAILGYNEFRAKNYAATDNAAGNAPLQDSSVKRGIKHAREELGCDIVIPFLHWGDELVAEPRSDQRKMAHEWIDAGATAVIGTHPHVTQTIDFYRGAPIVYSLGNFVFDYFPGDPSEWTGWVAILNIDAYKKVELEIRSVVIEPSGLPKILSGD